tara:strand:- start:790 stop:996 length:207 start_codon:yes stop_codon:yes gene_type:complete
LGNHETKCGHSRRETKTKNKKGAVQEICRVNKLINYLIGKISLMSLRSSHIYTLKEDLKKIPLAVEHK